MSRNRSISTHARFEAVAEFVAIARRLSFTQAAQDLEVDASALGRRIAALEARLGVRLLQRTTRRVTLTEAGTEFLVRAQDLLARLNEAEAVVSQHAAEPQGRLRVAVPNLFGQKHIAPLVPEFMARYPALRVELTFSDRFDDLLDARLDCAVRIGALERGGDLIVRRLAPNRRILCASPEYLVRHGSPDKPADLAGHRLLHFRPLIYGSRWKLQKDGITEEIVINPWLAADNADVLRLAAVEGQGIALLATFVVGDALRSGKLVPVLAEWRPPDSQVSIVYPNAPFTPLRVRAFIDFMAEKFQAGPIWDRGLSL